MRPTEFFITKGKSQIPTLGVTNKSQFKNIFNAAAMHWIEMSDVPLGGRHISNHTDLNPFSQTTLNKSSSIIKSKKKKN